MEASKVRPYGLALAAAAFFGASFPLSKLLLRDLGPIGLAGMLYLSSGLGLSALRLTLRGRGEAGLKRSDLGWLSGVILSGGVAGPILLLLGLSQTGADVSALLANTETVFTMALAVLFFGDFLLRREAAGTALILGGATLVAWAGASQGGKTSWQGPLLLLGAGLAWGLDNNFSQKLSAKDPLQVAMVKGIAAGVVNLSLAASTEGLPRLSPEIVGSAFGVGFACYGLSIVFFITALRHLGGAKFALSDHFRQEPLRKVAVLCSGSQGEPGIAWRCGGFLLLHISSAIWDP